ncbi:prepilin-type N-terminal cleavage/methylation domain-containing protein [Postechiella marina]|uniref:prepilin-type N-terminal cleavage/methylation domain-containing protein n=1 Tax=Postechiella marina TaxID=943941 RepID=UPI0031DF2ADF
MRTKHKIKAFTLSEMVVVIIITSIVVGIAFAVLQLVQKHMRGIKYNFSENTVINTFEQSLWVDFNKYSKIKYNKKEDALIFASEIDSTIYKFENDYILKRRDTFNIQIQNKAFFFDGNKIEKGQVDALKLEGSKSFPNQRLFIFKRNSATSFMN